MPPRKILQAWGLLFICVFFLTACRPSQPQPDAIDTQSMGSTSAARTMSAPTATRTASPTATLTPSVTPTLTPTLTNTPTPTYTNTPTPTITATPKPDAKAMINWKALGLPASFRAFPPSALSIDKADEATRIDVNGQKKPVPIENSFLFVNEDVTQLVYGYTFIVPAKSYQAYYQNKMQQPNLGYPITKPSALTIPKIGEDMLAVSGSFSTKERLDIVDFRVGTIQISVFELYLDGETPAIPVERLAWVYRNSILNPQQTCRLISITPVKGSKWPVFEIKAQGFYPFEPRGITISGEVIQAGKLIKIGADKLGQTVAAKKTDQEGRLVDKVSFGPLKNPKLKLPEKMELELTLTGQYSGCKIHKILKWPGP